MLLFSGIANALTGVGRLVRGQNIVKQPLTERFIYRLKQAGATVVLGVVLTCGASSCVQERGMEKLAEKTEIEVVEKPAKAVNQFQLTNEEPSDFT